MEFVFTTYEINNDEFQQNKNTVKKKKKIIWMTMKASTGTLSELLSYIRAICNYLIFIILIYFCIKQSTWKLIELTAKFSKFFVEIRYTYVFWRPKYDYNDKRWGKGHFLSEKYKNPGFQQFLKIIIYTSYRSEKKFKKSFKTWKNISLIHHIFFL